MTIFIFGWTIHYRCLSHNFYLFDFLVSYFKTSWIVVYCSKTLELVEVRSEWVPPSLCLFPVLCFGFWFWRAGWSKTRADGRAANTGTAEGAWSWAAYLPALQHRDQLHPCRGASGDGDVCPLLLLLGHQTSWNTEFRFSPLSIQSWVLQLLYWTKNTNLFSFASTRL